MKKQLTFSVSSRCSEQRGTFSTASYLRHRLLRAAVLGLALMLSSQLSSAMLPPVKFLEMQMLQNDRNRDTMPENLTLRGIVRDESNAPFPGVNIYLKRDNTVGTTSDASGAFKLAGDIQPGDVIIFSFLGYEPVEYVVAEVIPEMLEIALTDFQMMMGEGQPEGPYQQESQVSQLWQRVKNIF